MSVRVGLVGTGYAAKKRAEAITTSERATLVAIAGHSLDRTQAFAQPYAAVVEPDWQTLVDRPDLDLIIVATRNHLHGAVVRTALLAHKHVVVEYPLALDLAEATELIKLAQTHQRLLHVEHIELLSSIHQTLKAALPQIGTPCYGRYSSFKAERPAPQKWSYDTHQFGFPLMGALSRVQRLIDIFGPVATVSCQHHVWSKQADTLVLEPDATTVQTYAATVCTAHLTFTNGVLAELVYGKGEGVWGRDRLLDIHGSQGRILLEPQGGQVIDANGSYPLTVGSRRGLFAKDTAMVLDALENGSPLYITPEQSLYALTVADTARQSAIAQHVIQLN